MSYANNYNRGGNFNNRGFSYDRGYQSNDRPQYERGYQRRQGNQKKHSGARFVKTEKGGFISAWKYTRAGMLSITANFWKKAPSANYEWECWVVNILNRSTGQTSTHTALFNPKNNKLRISKLNWVINPNAPNGGYCGMSFSKEFKPRK